MSFDPKIYYSFTNKVNTKRRNDALFSEGLEMLKQIKAEHSETILQLYMLSSEDWEIYANAYSKEHPNQPILPKDMRGMECSKIRELAETISAFLPTNTNIIFPLKGIDRKKNILEEIERFEAQNAKPHPRYQAMFKASGLPEEYNFAKKLEVDSQMMWVRVCAYWDRDNAIKEGKFTEKFDGAIEGIKRRHEFLLSMPEQVIVLGEREINTKNLTGKAENLITDLTRLRESEAGQTLLKLKYRCFLPGPF